MDLFFCETLTRHQTIVHLSPQESHHLRIVLRKDVGETIALTNGKGLRATAVIKQVNTREVVCEIQSIEKLPIPATRNITVALATIRPNRMDWAVEKLTELGVSHIIPIWTQYTAIRAFKIEHLRKIAINALKQSKQVYLPEMHLPLPFGEWISGLTEESDVKRYIAHPIQSGVYLNIDLSSKPRKYILAIGPEGGFSKEEVQAALSKGFLPIKLEETVLRTETAAVVAVAQLKLLLNKRNR